MTVEVQDDDMRLLELANVAAGGEDVVLVRDGKPFARIINNNPLGRRFGFLEGYGFKVPEDFNELGREEIEKMFYGEDE